MLTATRSTKAYVKFCICYCMKILLYNKVSNQVFNFNSPVCLSILAFCFSIIIYKWRLLQL